MDRPSFEEAVQIAERHRAALEAAGSTSAEQIARTHRRPEMFGALIDRSKVSRTYWDAAKLVAYQLRRRGESLPPELNDWAVDAFTGIRPRSVARGRDPYENTQRDWLIYVVVKKLEAVGFHATRNKATGDAKGTACAKGGTACDAVGQALGLGYKAVEKIWESFRALEIAGSPGDSSEAARNRLVRSGAMTHLLTRSEVEARCALSKTSIYRLMRTGTFPEPVVVGTRAVRWNEDEIAEWLASRPRSHGDGIHRATRRHRDAAR